MPHSSTGGKEGPCSLKHSYENAVNAMQAGCPKSWYGQESAAHSSAAHSISPYATEYAAMPIHPRLAGSMRYFVFASKPRSE